MKSKPIEKIYWKSIKGGFVTVTNDSYWYDGALVFWHGHESAEAQMFLNKRVR